MAKVSRNVRRFEALYAHNTYLARTEVHQLQRVSEAPQLLPPSPLLEILKALPCTSLCRQGAAAPATTLAYNKLAKL
eukprot:4798-Heterococcus_DN1.PRE.2